MQAEVRDTLPGDGQVFLDHVGFFVPDMSRAAAAMEALGFSLTPFTRQTTVDPVHGGQVAQGTANRCAMLERGYLEVLTPVADTALAAEMRAGLARYAGLHLIALAVADAAAHHARLRAAGFDPRPPVHLRRPVEIGARTREAAFTVIRVPPRMMPEGRVQILTHHTPEVVWRAGATAQPNGATALSAVLLCVADPETVAARYARFAGRGAGTRGGTWSVVLDRGRIDFVDPARCAEVLGGPPPAVPCLAAVALGTGAPDAAGELLRARGVRLLGADRDCVRVHPAAGLGATMVLHAAGASPAWAAAA